VNVDRPVANVPVRPTMESSLNAASFVCPNCGFVANRKVTEPRPRKCAKCKVEFIYEPVRVDRMRIEAKAEDGGALARGLTEAASQLAKLYPGEWDLQIEAQDAKVGVWGYAILTRKGDNGG
jgi:predicted RNA-binding Zn-ribbon protein involved in translation (DUF1610 family)